MKRRHFLKTGSLAAIGTTFFNNLNAASNSPKDPTKIKNIIFMVSDGMSIGTLTMANMLAQLKHKRLSHWFDLYQHPNTFRALMDTASESSLVTDSAAASSAWGGGKRVPNGSLNVNSDGSYNTPILQKFKNAGKSVGCITTVPITHATPAGFCVAVDKRNNQEYIGELYTTLDFDIFLGGGKKYIDGNLRSDKKDLINTFSSKGYQLVFDKEAMHKAQNKKLIGLFADDALPYSVDQIYDPSLSNIPTLAEMLSKGLTCVGHNPKGFFIQVEGGKVDWAAHANDTGALLYDQLAFDDAIKVAKTYVDQHPDTLLIITTDHGNANPGLFYGQQANSNFEKILQFRQSNDTILNSILPSDSTAIIQTKIEEGLQIKIKDEEAANLQRYYTNLNEEGVYNYKKLPYKYLGELLKKYTSVGFGDMDHSGDVVELTMHGKGAEKLPPLIMNFELHNYILRAAGLL